VNTYHRLVVTLAEADLPVIGVAVVPHLAADATPEQHEQARQLLARFDWSLSAQAEWERRWEAGEI
jgi:hypothetical protein